LFGREFALIMGGKVNYDRASEVSRLFWFLYRIFGKLDDEALDITNCKLMVKLPRKLDCLAISLLIKVD
jgi:hypothetical protein